MELLATGCYFCPMTSSITHRLGDLHCGYRGRISALSPQDAHSSISADELESRLLELGFVEGAEICVLHEAPWGRDPIAVRVDNMTIAIRRREAMAILVEDSSS